MRLLSSSRQYLYVPVVLLTARPEVNQVDLAVIPGGAEPADADWIEAEWLDNPAGRMLGAGFLAGTGPGYGARPIPQGEWLVVVREHLPGGEVIVWPWTRLTVGL